MEKQKLNKYTRTEKGKDQLPSTEGIAANCSREEQKKANTRNSIAADYIVDGFESLHQKFGESYNSYSRNEMLQLEIITDSGHDLGNTQSQKRRIEKVPLILRKDENKNQYYNPRLVSLGPYHHGEEELQLVEKFKPKVLQMFVSDSGKHLAEFHNKVLELIDDAKSCYVVGSTEKCSAEAFARMMLLDACFVLFYMEVWVYKRRSLFAMRRYLGLSVWINIYDDLFLLENQLPFQLLEGLMSLKFEESEGKKMINAFVRGKCTGNVHLMNLPEVTIKKPLHLLEALRAIILPLPEHGEVMEPADRTFDDVKTHVYSFRSVTELKAKGIQFRPNKTESLKDIKFISFSLWGRLKLPIRIVGTGTALIFTNLIAYEMCPNNPYGFGVTAYVSFMKSLIDHPDDVKELRSKKILYNNLGSDEEVVKLFKEIPTYGLRDWGAYTKIRESIQKHCDSKLRTWMADLYYKYFSSPWSAIALFAAICLLVLNFLQAYYKITRRGN